MQERRADEIERWAHILQRLDEQDAKIAELAGRNGKTDEEIIGILYKEVGKGTVSFLAKLFLSICGVAGAALLAYFGFKGISAK